MAMIDSKESAWIYSESVGVSTAVLPWTDESYVARVDQRTRILYVYNKHYTSIDCCRSYLYIMKMVDY